MHMYLEASALSSKQSISTTSTTTKIDNNNSTSSIAMSTINKYDSFYFQASKQIESIKKYQLNSDLVYKEKVILSLIIVNYNSIIYYYLTK
jgi:hypothetical protein